MRQIRIPTSEEEWLDWRVDDITSSEMGGILGLEDAYSTYFELWMRKKNKNYVKLDLTERLEMGNVFQDPIANYVAKKNGWKIRRMNEYINIPSLRIGSSFDFCIVDENDKPIALIEVKNIDYFIWKRKWIPDDSGNKQASLQIEAQVQTQLFVSGLDKCYIIAGVGGNHIEIIERTADPIVQNFIQKKCAEFWLSIDENREPLPNYEVDAGFVASLYSFAEPGTMVDISADDNLTVLANDYKKFGDDIKVLESDREAIKAQLLTAIGSAEKATGNGFSITAGMVAAAEVAYTRSAYRGFRVNWKKAK